MISERMIPLYHLKLNVLCDSIFLDLIVKLELSFLSFSLCLSTLPLFHYISVDHWSTEIYFYLSLISKILERHLSTSLFTDPVLEDEGDGG